MIVGMSNRLGACVEFRGPMAVGGYGGVAFVMRFCMHYCLLPGVRMKTEQHLMVETGEQQLTSPSWKMLLHSPYWPATLGRSRDGIVFM